MKFKERPTVLHLRGSSFFGSPERLIDGQMRKMDGFSSVCASFKNAEEDNAFLKEMRARGHAAFEIEDRGRYDRKMPKKIRELIKSNGIDLLVTHEYKSNYYGRKALKKLKIPHVAYFHGWTDEDFKVRFYNFLDRRVLRKVDLVITVSRHTARRLAAAGVPENKIKVVYNAIEVKESYPDHIENEIPVIGVVGRLSREKGVHVLLDAVSRVKKKGLNFKVEITGTGPSEEQLKKQSSKLGLDKIVDFRGFVGDIDDIYRRIDILALPSLSEGHPLVILEAWARGIGIVATKAGGVPEVIQDGKSGILCDIDNSRALAEAIEKALTDPYKIKAMGRAGKSLLEERYNFNIQSEILSDLYHRVLDSGKIK